jgi:hypothetical protein
MNPVEESNISISGEVVEPSSIWDDPEQRALAEALAAEFERWADHNVIAVTDDGEPKEP